DRKLAEPAAACDYCGVFQLGLRDQHSIERILMFFRKGSCLHTACSIEIGSSTKPSLSTLPRKSLIRSGTRNLPAWCLIAISHAEAEETRTVASASAMARWAAGDNLPPPSSHQIKACVSSSTFVTQYPT